MPEKAIIVVSLNNAETDFKFWSKQKIEERKAEIHQIDFTQQLDRAYSICKFGTKPDKDIPMNGDEDIQMVSNPGSNPIDANIFEAMEGSEVLTNFEMSRKLMQHLTGQVEPDHPWNSGQENSGEGKSGD